MGGSGVITKTLGLLYLLSSAEVFAAVRRMETTGGAAANIKHPDHHHHHHGDCVHDLVNGQQDACMATAAAMSPMARLTQGLWNRPGTGCSAATGTCADNKKHQHSSSARHLMKHRGGHGAGAHAHHGGGAAGSLTTLGMSLPFFKILLQLLLTGLNVACWLVPMKIKRFRENQELISLANAFSGGVFLSLAFGHMIPHSLEGFELAGFAHNVPFLVTLAGYLLIFFVEKIAFDTHGFIEEHHHHHHGSSSKAADDKKKNGGAAVAAGGASSPTGGASGRSAVILLLALAVHSIFETMALGLSDTPVQAGLLATSIALHQPAESIALLVAFLKSGLSEAQTTRYLSIFSAIGTVGVFMGLAVSSFAGAVWDSVFVALTAGTFIYVGCTEIVAEEFEEPERKWQKFGALLAGVVIVGAITMVTEAWEH